MQCIMGRAWAKSQTALFTEHSNADKKKRRTVADSVANVGESVGVNTRT